jgi:hypothetical protein
MVCGSQAYLSGISVQAGQSDACFGILSANRLAMNGGNTLALQTSWANLLAMTMRYAHLAPEYLRDALKFGPVRDFRRAADLESKSPRNSRNFRGLGYT